MKKKQPERVNITSKIISEFETAIEIGDDKFLVQTEDLGTTKHEIVTSTYLGGQITSSVRTSYGSLLKDPDLDYRVHILMQKQHKEAVRLLREEKDKTASEYLDDLKVLLRRKNHKAAIHLLMEALESYPDNAFLLSYYGSMISIAEKKHKDGIAICKSAIEKLDSTVPFGQEFFYPVFYLNLGRAYLAADLKKEAIDAFVKGLAVDGNNTDLKWEMKKLGERKSPPLPFLPRGSFINKYIGKVRYKLFKR